MVYCKYGKPIKIFKTKFITDYFPRETHFDDNTDDDVNNDKKSSS